MLATKVACGGGKSMATAPRCGPSELSAMSTFGERTAPMPAHSMAMTAKSAPVAAPTSPMCGTTSSCTAVVSTSRARSSAANQASVRGGSPFKSDITHSMDPLCSAPATRRITRLCALPFGAVSV
jgi:hypothetical protein